MTDSLYREIILDHWKNPHNYGVIKQPDIDVQDINVLCGDEIHITAKLSKGKIEQIAFTGDGCAISIASASILTDNILGKKVEEIKKIKPEELLEMLGIELTLARTKCALLSYSTLQRGLQGNPILKSSPLLLGEG